MEDFSSIIWTVFVIGVMIFSVANQRKKQEAAQKHKKQANDEAWPGASEDEGPAPWSPEHSRPAPHPMQEAERMPGRQPARAQEFSAPDDDATLQEDSELFENTATREISASAQSATIREIRTAVPAAETHFPGEIGSNDSFTGSKMPISGYPQKPKPKASLPAGSEQQAHRDETHPDEDPVAEIREDFDLRKAIVYSEILKPKFDE